MRKERKQGKDAEYEENRVDDRPARDRDHEQDDSDYQPEHLNLPSS
jgi:hypothetical protein